MNQEATGSCTTWGIKCPSEASDTETPPSKEVCSHRSWKIPHAAGTAALISLNSMFPAGRDPLPISGSVKGGAYCGTMGCPPP